MLVLSRNIQESIVIDDDITITILSVKGKQVRIGFSAPDDVEIHREEVHKRILAEKTAVECVSVEDEADVRSA